MILKSPKLGLFSFAKLSPYCPLPRTTTLTYNYFIQKRSRDFPRITYIPIGSPAHTLVFLTELFSTAERPSPAEVLPSQKSLFSEKVASKAK